MKVTFSPQRMVITLYTQLIRIKYMKKLILHTGRKGKKTNSILYKYLLPDTLFPNIDGVFILIQRNTFSVRSDKSIPT